MFAQAVKSTARLMPFRAPRAAGWRCMDSLKGNSRDGETVDRGELISLFQLTTRLMREEIRHIQQNLGITTIYVTHDQEEAMAVSDRVAIFYNGSLQQVADPQGIYFSPANKFTAEFMGSCNILEMTPLSWDAAQGLAHMLCGGEKFEVAMNNSHGVCHEKPHAQAPEPPQLHEPVNMMLRPDWIHETPPAATEQNVFTGHVHDVMFLGTMVVYQVAALGTLLRVDVPALQCGDFKKVGDAITLCFSPASPVKVGA